MIIQKPRGTNDFYGKEMKQFLEISQSLRECSEIYGFSPIKTPMFESTDLFLRNIGEDTDVVSKEMYTFSDKGDRSITLRPELTAPAIRLYLENKLYGETFNVHKLTYLAECFRYDRPGEGRFREFHQFGVELIGSELIDYDLEIINFALLIIEKFNLQDQIILKVNSLGKNDSRDNYQKELVNYFSKYKDNLCKDCQVRLEKNPLRILDCKVDSGKEFIQNAPKILDYLTEEELDRFTQITENLIENKVAFEVDQKMVRGLDYYNDLIFEFVDKNSNLTVIAGGRYDKLIGKLHKEEIPAIGFGLGVERLTKLINENNPTFIEEFSQVVDVYFVPLCNDAKIVVQNSMKILRANGIRVETDFTMHVLKSQLKKADSLNAVYAVIIGEKEITENFVTVKNLRTKEQVTTKIEDFEKDLLIEE